jgi:hypothetical protein
MAALTSWAGGDVQKSATCITGVGGSIEFQQQRKRRHRPLGGRNNLSESGWAKSFATGVLALEESVYHILEIRKQYNPATRRTK